MPSSRPAYTTMVGSNSPLRSVSLLRAATSKAFIEIPEWTSLAGGLAAAMAGAILAAGLMFYRMLADDITYTAESWIAIPTLWIGVAVLWSACFKWSYWALAPTIGLAIFAGTYFRDVFGHYALAIFLVFALIKVTQETLRP